MSPSSQAPRRRRRILLWLALGALFAAGAVLAQAWVPIGRWPRGERLERVRHSPEWRDGRFRDPQPMRMNTAASFGAMLHSSPDVVPAVPLPVVRPPRETWSTPPASGVRVTWFGHSSTLVEVDGHRVLFDPIWSERASPLSWAGPRRFYPPPVALADLPRLDAVVISHDHYDHLDRDTVLALAERGVVFVVPMGVGAHLAYWGVPEGRILELDWWDRAHVNGLTLVAVPARHASGRTLVPRDPTLWAGYALLGDTHRVYYSGDSGLVPALHEIGDRLGPFDLTLIECGQYNAAWPDWHMGPEQAVTAHLWVKGRWLLPVHWGLFSLAPHGWTEPVERVLAAAQAQGVNVITPRPGQSVEPGAPHSQERWWPALAWSPATRTPIVSTQLTP